MNKEQFINAFLSWKIPDSTMVDNIQANGKFYNNSTGTNIFSAIEAAQLFDEVIKPLLEKIKD